MKAPARSAGRTTRSAKRATGSTAKTALTGSGAKAKAASPPKTAGRGARHSASARATASATAEFDALLRRIHSDIDEAHHLLAEATPG